MFYHYLIQEWSKFRYWKISLIFLTALGAKLPCYVAPIPQCKGPGNMSILWAFGKLTLETFADVLHLLLCGCTCVSITGIHVMLKVCKRRHQAMLLEATFVGCGKEGEGSPRVTEGHTVGQTTPIWLLGILSTLEVMSGGSIRGVEARKEAVI